MNLRGRGVLITGANQGLGKAIAQACVREGAHVFLCARNRDLLESTRADWWRKTHLPRKSASARKCAPTYR